MNGSSRQGKAGMLRVLLVLLAAGIAFTPDRGRSQITGAGAAELAAEAYLNDNLAGARYMSGRSSECGTTPIREWPNYEKRDVVRCKYTFTSNGQSLSGIVYLLNPTKENIT